MNKTWIIIQREFLSRVRKKTFLLSTILLPILLAGVYAGMIYFSVKGNDEVKIAVSDKANIFQNELKNNDDISFTFLNDLSAKQLEDSVRAKKYTGYLYIPENINLATDSLNIKSVKSIGLFSSEKIKGRINSALREKKLLALVSRSQLDSAQRNANFTISRLDGNNKPDKAITVYAVGFGSGMIIYIVLLIYGTMVMRGVMEEKTNRIAEVIVSSVKPFQLMMGKIIGIGAVGLLQFLIWIVLTLVLKGVIFSGMDSSPMGQQIPAEGAAAFFSALSSVNIPLILGCFIFYFLGGYLLYSSLFAAVGTAVDEDPQAAQGLMLPITMPIIFAIMIMIKAVNDPNSSLAVFGSIFPLTSPVVMIARIAHGVPEGVSVAEILISMALLIVGFLGTTWVAGKIYRTGILMYGKKITWKEMWKWAFRKN
ncbi:ABC transporter permease [Pseudoflavitalea sp. G-6-1-2]|uniref:ABC transporter permease n=1 Tax=Pseudoflavitalea sp. G-6-1-2 TaxID=2728841 RepID=UPI00146A36B8|nr:ABC transporter permease [Pseudoflavitalea sp. G-6-1-2]NML20788.1 ABC transporter permease [Pseudoflavitalea sp. G-6-1-2]